MQSQPKRREVLDHRYFIKTLELTVKETTAEVQHAKMTQSSHYGYCHYLKKKKRGLLPHMTRRAKSKMFLFKERLRNDTIHSLQNATQKVHISLYQYQCHRDE